VRVGIQSVLLAVTLSAVPASPASQRAIRLLTSDAAADDYWPCFSPDGKTVLFARSLDRRKTWDLFVIPTAGGTARRLAQGTLPVSASRPNWSWRHDIIAFTGEDAEGRAAAWTIDPAGRKAERVRAEGLSSRVLYPAWYPDGRHLAVLDAGADALMRIDRRGGAAVRLTDPGDVSPGMARVSPDGRWIAFAGQKATGRPADGAKNATWLLGPSGGPRPLEAIPAQGRTPAWSPDGRRIAFQSNRESPNGLHALFVVNRDGTGLVRVTGYDRDANHPEWSPDGRRLVFALRHAPERTPTGIAIIELEKPDR